MSDEPKFEGMNEEVSELYQAMGDAVSGYIHRPPGDLPPEAQIMYERGDAGRCMTCGTPLGEHACALVNEFGLAMVYCDFECLGSMLFSNYHATEWDKLHDRINEKSDDQA